MEMTTLARGGGTGVGGIREGATAWAVAAYIGFGLGERGVAIALPLPPITLSLAKGPGFPRGGLGPACLTAVPDTVIGTGGTETAATGAT